MNKMRKLLFCISAALFSAITFSSAQITFQKTFGGTGYDYGWSVQQTLDGGYIIAGQTQSFTAGDYDVYLIRTDVNGDTLWTKTFGGTGDEYGASVQQTMDGGYIIAGQTLSFGAGDADVYLVRTDASGDTLWTKTFGGTDVDLGSSVRQTTDGGYIITGRTVSFGAGVPDVYLIRTDTIGNLLWTKTFGGSQSDYGQSVQQTADGGYIVTGYTYSFTFGTGSPNVYLIKTDTGGNALWTKILGSTDDDDGLSVQQTTDGGYIIAGDSYGFGAGASDVYVIKTDADGDSLWSKTYGGTSDDYGTSVQQTADGGYIITGVTVSFGSGNGDVYLIKTDANGDTSWTRTLGGTGGEEGFSVQQTADGGYIICGFTGSFGAGNQDVYLIKTDSFGNSGCNQGNPATIVTTTSTMIANPATIIFSPSATVTNPGAIVGSGGMVTMLCTSVGINEIVLNNSFIIFPNPAAGYFIISFEEPIMKGNVEILNTFGENVFRENIFNESKKEINLKPASRSGRNIAGGIYFVKVFDGEKYYCRKIIIEKN